MKISTIAVFGMATVIALAAPAAWQHWTAAQVSASGKTLATKLTNGVGTEKYGDWGNHQLLVIHRNATGQSELHETQSDVLVIRAGEGSMQMGGTMRHGKTTTEHEVRGDGIDGGETIALKPGDIVHVSPKIAHQVILKPGQTIDYLAIKVDAQ